MAQRRGDVTVMTDTTHELQWLDAPAAERLAPQFAALLQDAVASGASLGFWQPLDDTRADAYWRDIIAEVAAGERWLLAALGDGNLLGSVQLAFSSWKQNAIHRAEVQKLLVHQTARRRGLGQELMLAAERLALDRGKTLLILDTLTGSDAERLYHRLGFVEVGAIPRFVTEPDGAERSTTVFYKSLVTAR
jgi:GNAT superfamily N-acetyltransferase